MVGISLPLGIFGLSPLGISISILNDRMVYIHQLVQHLLNFPSSPFPLHIPHLHNTPSLVRIILNPTPLIARLRPLRKRRRQACSQVRDINIVQEGWVRHVRIHDLLRVDEEVLRGARDAGVFVGEAGDEDGGHAVVVEFPVNAAHGADGALVEADCGVDWEICGDVSVRK